VGLDPTGCCWRIGCSPVAHRWQAVEAYPQTLKPVLIVLGALLIRKRLPKQRKYVKGRQEHLGASESLK
jgi:hypothetical protein